MFYQVPGQVAEAQHAPAAVEAVRGQSTVAVGLAVYIDRPQSFHPTRLRALETSVWAALLLVGHWTELEQHGCFPDKRRDHIHRPQSHLWVAVQVEVVGPLTVLSLAVPLAAAVAVWISVLKLVMLEARKSSEGSHPYQCCRSGSDL